MHFPRCYMWAMAFLLTSPVALSAQATGVPNERFYPLVFRHILRLSAADTAATSATPTGGSTSNVPIIQPIGSAVQAFFSSRVGLGAAEETYLLHEAQGWQSDSAPIDAQAQSIISALHAQAPGGKLKPGAKPPAVPAALTQLQAQKDAVTLLHVTNLMQAFGTTRFKDVDHAIRSQVQTTTKAVTPPGSTNSAPVSQNN